MSADHTTQELRNVATTYELAALHKEVKDLRDQVEMLAHDRDRAMRWGLMVLGTAVLGMASWIFNFITNGHAK